MENRGLRAGLKGAADKSHVSGVGKGNRSVISQYLDAQML